MSLRIDFAGKSTTAGQSPGWKIALAIAIALLGIVATEPAVAQAAASNSSPSRGKRSGFEAAIRTLNGFIDHRDLSAFKQYVRHEDIDNKTLEYCFYEYLTVAGNNTGNGEEAVLISLFRYLKERGVDTDPHYVMGSPLLNAISHGYFELAKLIIKSGADVNAEMERERTPLMDACLAGNLEIAKMLVERGADVNAKGRVTARSPEGSITPLKAARASGNKRLVAYLIARGAKQ